MSRKFFAVSVALSVASVASADIGFNAAVDAARAAAPQGTLFGIKQRVRNGTWIYEGALYNAGITTRYEPRINRDTGELIRVNVNAVNPKSAAALQPIADRLGEVQVDFAAALATANADSGRTDPEVIQYDIEAGILAYQVDYFDGVTKSYIDAATGNVIPHHGNGGDDPSNPSTVIVAALGLAGSHMGEGWVVIGFENEAEDGGNIVEVLLINLKSGMASIVNVGGDAVLSSGEFSPVGRQAEKVAEIRANWGSVTAELSAAVEMAESAYPGASIHEASLEVEIEDAGTAMNWKINLITAEGFEIDYLVSASGGSGGGFRRAMAPVTMRAGDFNLDGVVDSFDIGEVFSAWGTFNPLMDVDGNEFVGSAEVAAIISNWG